jgi:hypothetical protein
MRLMLLILTAVLAVVAQSCDFAPEDLDIFIASNRVLVTNVGNSSASVTVQIGSKWESALLQPGGKLSVRSFESGVWTVLVVAADTRRSYFSSTIGNLSAHLSGTASEDGDYESTQMEIDELYKTIESTPEGEVPGSDFCKGTFPEKKSSDVDMTVSQKEQTGDWSCHGF